MAKKAYKTLTEKDFSFLKTLLDNDIKKSQVSKITGRSYDTLMRVEKADNFEAYKTLTHEKSQKMAQSKQAKTVTQSPVPESAELIKAVRELVTTNKQLIEALEKAYSNNATETDSPSLFERIFGPNKDLV